MWTRWNSGATVNLMPRQPNLITIQTLTTCGIRRSFRNFARSWRTTNSPAKARSRPECRQPGGGELRRAVMFIERFSFEKRKHKAAERRGTARSPLPPLAADAACRGREGDPGRPKGGRSAAAGADITPATGRGRFAPTPHATRGGRGTAQLKRQISRSRTKGSTGVQGV